MRTYISYQSPEELKEKLRTLLLQATVKITDPASIFRYLVGYASEPVENFLIVALDGAHQIIKVVPITKGLVNRTLVHPREIFRAAIEANSTAIILAHNHPSGVLDPSPEDKDITDRLTQAGAIIGIPVLDHLIIGCTGYWSFIEHGTMPRTKEGVNP